MQKSRKYDTPWGEKSIKTVDSDIFFSFDIVFSSYVSHFPVDSINLYIYIST